MLKCVGPLSALETCIDRFVENAKSGKKMMGNWESIMSSPVVQSGSRGPMDRGFGVLVIMAAVIVRTVSFL